MDYAAAHDVVGWNDDNRGSHHGICSSHVKGGKIHEEETDFDNQIVRRGHGAIL